MEVSVIIPCFNVEDCINTCIQSVLIQEIRDLEIICINDGSTDNTHQILQEIKKKVKETPITILSTTNKGSSHARNLGINFATGKYLQFLDADDYLLKNKIKNQINLLNKNNSLFVAGSYIWQDEKGSLIENVNTVFLDMNDAIVKLSQIRLGITSANLYSKIIFDNGIAWNETLPHGDDFALTLEILMKKHTICYDTELHCVKVERKKEISQFNKLRNHQLMLSILTDLRVFFIQNSADKTGLNMINNSIFNRIKLISNINYTLAQNLYYQHLNVPFVLENDKLSSKFYVACYNLLGFGMAEKLRKFKKMITLI